MKPPETSPLTNLLVLLVCGLTCDFGGLFPRVDFVSGDVRRNAGSTGWQRQQT
jgi:hypothetical protein